MCSSLTVRVQPYTCFVAYIFGISYAARPDFHSFPTRRSSDHAVVVLVVKVDPSDTADISNTASASSTTFDPDMTEESATATKSRDTAAYLMIVKEATATATAGSGFDYSLTVTNNGPSAHTGGV